MDGTREERGGGVREEGKKEEEEREHLVLPPSFPFSTAGAANTTLKRQRNNRDGQIV